MTLSAFLQISILHINFCRLPFLSSEESDQWHVSGLSALSDILLQFLHFCCVWNHIYGHIYTLLQATFWQWCPWLETLGCWDRMLVEI